ncbi:Uncharacterised protein [Acinetobacter baumannii]|nr:Uncharacterised protein [Acinetobacter baumannii]
MAGRPRVYGDRRRSAGDRRDRAGARRRQHQPADRPHRPHRRPAVGDRLLSGARPAVRHPANRQCFFRPRHRALHRRRRPAAVHLQPAVLYPGDDRVAVSRPLARQRRPYSGAAENSGAGRARHRRPGVARRCAGLRRRQLSDRGVFHRLRAGLSNHGHAVGVDVRLDYRHRRPLARRQRQRPAAALHPVGQPDRRRRPDAGLYLHVQARRRQRQPGRQRCSGWRSDPARLCAAHLRRSGQRLYGGADVHRLPGDGGRHDLRLRGLLLPLPAALLSRAGGHPRPLRHAGFQHGAGQSDPRLTACPDGDLPALHRAGVAQLQPEPLAQRQARLRAGDRHQPGVRPGRWPEGFKLQRPAARLVR